MLQFLAYPTPAHHSHHPESPSGRKHHVGATSLLFLLDVIRLHWHEHCMLQCIFVPLLSCLLCLQSGLQLFHSWNHLLVPPLCNGKTEAEGLQGACREQREPVSNTSNKFEQVLPAHRAALSPQGVCPLTSGWCGVLTSSLSGNNCNLMGHWELEE